MEDALLDSRRGGANDQDDGEVGGETASGSSRRGGVDVDGNRDDDVITPTVDVNFRRYKREPSGTNPLRLLAPAWLRRTIAWQYTAKRPWLGLACMVALGCLLGLVTPRNSDLSGPWAYISNCVGYTYVLAWTFSGYPQIILNWRRQKTEGFSFDHALLNVIGFVCLSFYSTCFYWVPSVEREYEDRHGGDSSDVELNDALFAVYGLLITSFSLGQVLHYDYFPGRRGPPSGTCLALVGLICVSIAVYLLLVIARTNGGDEPFAFIDFLYFLSYIKIVITICKYAPQVHLNYTRKSCAGWSIWNVLLDCMGGVLSVLQLLLDCDNKNDWSGIAGDPVKFCLGLISIFYDCVFIYQHYVLYP